LKKEEGEEKAKGEGFSLTEEYRTIINCGDLTPFRVKVEESNLLIMAQRNLEKLAEDILIKIRQELKSYIRKHPEFMYSFSPIKVEENAPYIVRLMAESSAPAGVGPMASVAGAIAEIVGKELKRESDEVIVENGGDIFISTAKERKVLIFAGQSPLSEKLALAIPPGTCGVATSSGKIGHSISTGKADAATVVARSAAVADAFATALGNRVKSKEDIESALEWISQLAGPNHITGAVVIMDKYAGFWGNIKVERP